MGEQTKIEWADSTFNPVWGCQKVSPACDFCYAEALDKRTGGKHWGPNAPRRRTSVQNWNKARKWNREADKFFSEHGRRRRVFCASMADVFDNQWEKEWRDDLWQLIRECPDMDWLLLTKRPQNIEKMKPIFWDEIKGHIWLGTTIENQEVADRNIPFLLWQDCAVRFLSCEPLLGHLNLRKLYQDTPSHYEPLNGSYHTVQGIAATNIIDWVITGGESGGRNTSRPADPMWFRSLREQCASHGTPFLFKQWGNWDEYQEYHRDKKALGRVLDGVTHDGFPNPTTIDMER